MAIHNGSVTISAGTGVTKNPDAPFIPLVRFTLAGEQATVNIDLTPGRARRIGLDLIAAASMAWANAGMRLYGRDHGVDSDTMIAFIQTMVERDLLEEEPRS